MIKHRLPENLKTLRLKKDILQREICARIEQKTGCRINQKQYSSYESGFCEPHIVTLKAMADYHDITMDDLCFKKLTN